MSIIIWIKNNILIIILVGIIFPNFLKVQNKKIDNDKLKMTYNWMEQLCGKV